MIKYPKTYEDVFSKDPPRSSAALKAEKIEIDGMGVEEYRLFFKDFISDFYLSLFDYCVRLSWLRKRFGYAGNRIKTPTHFSSLALQDKFVKFLRRLVGHDIQIITKGFFFSKLENAYFVTFFPDFVERNPFKDPEYFKFPYDNISLEFLILVYQLDDRFDLLKVADEQKMTYASFLDYVINHIFTINEYLGRDRYTLELGANNRRALPLYFKDGDKSLKSIRKNKK